MMTLDEINAKAGQVTKELVAMSKAYPFFKEYLADVKAAEVKMLIYASREHTAFIQGRCQMLDWISDSLIEREDLETGEAQLGDSPAASTTIHTSKEY